MSTPDNHSPESSLPGQSLPGMFTRCSHCHTAYRISPEALARTRGRVRCRACGSAFDALEHLARTPGTHHVDAERAHTPSPQGTLDLPPPDAPANPPPRIDALTDILAAHADFIEPVEEMDAADDDRTGAPQETAPVSSSEVLDDTDADAAPLEPAVATGPSPDIDSTTPASETGDGETSSLATTTEQPHIADSGASSGAYSNAASSEAATTPRVPSSSEPTFAPTARDTVDPHHPVLDAPTPSFIPTAAMSVEVPRQRTWPRWLAVAVLALLLCAQSIHAEREYLAADARWRPALERICATIGCALPAWHDPAALRLLTRDVRPHPSVPDALLISASFRNDALWAQHWPRLHLRLSDLNGQTIAEREFAPDQYLGMTARDLTIQPDQTASVALEVRDPGKQAVAFEFDFR